MLIVVKLCVRLEQTCRRRHQVFLVSQTGAQSMTKQTEDCMGYVQAR